MYSFLRIEYITQDCFCKFNTGLVTFIIVTMPFHNTQYTMGYNIMAQPHGLTMSL